MDPSYNSKNQGIGNDRLRKAIERNRRKIFKNAPGSRTSPTPPSHNTASPFSSAPPNSPFGQNAINRPASNYSPMSSTRPASPFAPRPSPFSPPSSHSNGLNWQSKMRAIPKKRGWFYKITTRLGWCVCLFLLARLIFSQRGVIDYYKRRDILETRNNSLYELKLESDNLVKEMKKIRTNEVYKKQLVRDRLGFIAADEFLILFRKDSADQSSLK